MLGVESRIQHNSLPPFPPVKPTKTKNVVFRSTKGASKQRRDLINAEISLLRDLLPLPESTRQRLSQLQIMSLTCVYIRKSNFFSRLFGNVSTPKAEDPGFSQSLNGFLLTITRDGKLLHISDNVTEYLGHSMVDMLTQGDSIYDIIDKRDHSSVQTHLLKTPLVSEPGAVSEEKAFFCRMNVSRSFRRQAGFGDHKVMHIRGHFVCPMIQDHFGNQPVFTAFCSPLITPDIKETVIQNNTMVFRSVHGLNMKFMELAQNGEHHLGYKEEELKGKSWYQLIHPDDLNEAKDKHVQLIKSSHEMGCMLTIRLMSKHGEWVWVNMVMHIRQPYQCENAEPAIVCINHIIPEKESHGFKLQSQLYSSHIARSPEIFNSSASSNGSPQAISQIPKDSTDLSSVQEESGNLNTDLALAMLSGCDNQLDGISLTDPFDDVASASIQLESKEICRADVLNRLKRKMSESSGQCKPSKMAKVSSDEGTRSTGGFSYTGNVTFSSLLGSSSNMGGMTESPVYFSSDLITEPPAYVQLKDVNVNIKQQMVYNSIDLCLPISPLTPNSEMSENSNHGDFTSFTVDANDVAVVPSSLLTPDSSPASSPKGNITHQSTLNDIASLEEMSFFSEKAVSGIKQEKQFLPELDHGVVEKFLVTLDASSPASQTSLEDMEEIKEEVKSVKEEEIDLLSMCDSFLSLVPESLLGCDEEAAELPSSHEQLIQELNQLNQLAGSPNHGDSDLESTLFNSTM